MGFSRVRGWGGRRCGGSDVGEGWTPNSVLWREAGGGGFQESSKVGANHLSAGASAAVVVKCQLAGFLGGGEEVFSVGMGGAGEKFEVGSTDFFGVAFDEGGRRS